MEYDTHALCAQLGAFIARRSGLEAGNYFDPRQPDPEGVKAFSSGRYALARDGRDARTMLSYIENRSADRFNLYYASCIAWGGRLSFERGRVEYCTGQNFSVEYRSAACAVLAQAIRDDWRANSPNRKTADLARSNFGCGIASRWFS